MTLGQGDYSMALFQTTSVALFHWYIKSRSAKMTLITRANDVLFSLLFASQNGHVYVALAMERTH